MPAEIRIAVLVSLPEDPTGHAAPAKQVLLAWEAFTAAIKSCDVIGNDFYLGPSKQRRRRRSKPRLVSEPPTAA